MGPRASPGIVPSLETGRGMSQPTFTEEMEER